MTPRNWEFRGCSDLRTFSVLGHRVDPKLKKPDFCNSLVFMIATSSPSLCLALKKEW